MTMLCGITIRPGGSPDPHRVGIRAVTGTCVQG
jgi:hypothetical protein